MTLGERICQLRTRHGLSQVDLADRLAISRQSVSKWGPTPPSRNWIS